MKVQPKSILLVILVVFAVYAIVVSPQTAADAVRSAFMFVADVFRSIFTFFDALLNR